MSPIGQTKYSKNKPLKEEPRRRKFINRYDRTKTLDRHLMAYGQVSRDDLHNMSFSQGIDRVVQLAEKRLCITLEQIKPNLWGITN